MSLNRQKKNLGAWWGRLPTRTRRDVVVFAAGATLVAVLSWLF